jgi:hypothetical protein
LEVFDCQKREKLLDIITKKLYGIGITKLLIGTKPRMGIPEFKFMVARHKLRKEWFDVVKELENRNVIHYRHNCIQICLSQEALFAVYNYNVEQKSDHSLLSDPMQPKQKLLKKLG